MDLILQFLYESDIRDETYQELFTELEVSAIKYSTMRMNWHFFTREEKMEKDSLRTGMHDSFMMNLKMLLRYVNKNIQDVADMLEDVEQKEKTNRKELGDLACKIACHIAILER